MKKKTENIIKGVGAVMGGGGTAAMIGSAVMNSGSTSTKKKVKKTADKAVKTINDIIDGVTGMM